VPSGLELKPINIDPRSSFREDRGCILSIEEEPENDLPARRLCSECVGEAFLSKEIENEGEVAVCSYCNVEGRTFSIEKMADRIETAFEQHFERTATEPSGMEYAMINDKESDYDWERKGEPVVEAISQAAEIDEKPAEDIRQVLEARHYDQERDEMGEEGPFDSDAYYAENEVNDAEFQAGWLHFEQSLKNEARYFSRTAEATLESIFEGISEHKTHDGQPIVVEAGAETALPAGQECRLTPGISGGSRTHERPWNLCILWSQ
jgi:hypothetical protein